MNQTQSKNVFRAFRILLCLGFSVALGADSSALSQSDFRTRSSTRPVRLAQIIINPYAVPQYRHNDDDESIKKLPGLEKLRAQVDKISNEIKASPPSPKSAELYLTRARLLLENSFQRLAYLDCLQAEKLASSDSKCLLWKAYCMRFQSDSEGALWIVHKILKEDPKNALAHAVKGSILTSSNPCRAFEEASLAVELEPKNAFFLVIRASANFANDNFDDAIEDANQALALDPDYMPAKLAVAYASQKQERYKYALDKVNEILRDAPYLASCYYLRAEIVSELGDSKSAKKDRALFNSYNRLMSEEQLGIKDSDDD